MDGWTDVILLFPSEPEIFRSFPKGNLYTKSNLEEVTWFDLIDLGSKTCWSNADELNTVDHNLNSCKYPSNLVLDWANTLLLPVPPK